MKKLVFLFALLALGACASSDKPKEEPPKEKETEVKTENLICPQVAILREADETYRYAGDKTDDADLITKVRLASINGDCAYRKDDGKPTGIDIAFTLDAVAAKGARLEGHTIELPYFVAIVDPSENVLSRQTLTARFKFAGEKNFAENFEPLHVFIPIPKKDLESGPDYRVLVGFTKPSH